MEQLIWLLILKCSLSEYSTINYYLLSLIVPIYHNLTNLKQNTVAWNLGSMYLPSYTYTFRNLLYYAKFWSIRSNKTMLLFVQFSFPKPTVALIHRSILITKAVKCGHCKTEQWTNKSEHVRTSLSILYSWYLSAPRLQVVILRGNTSSVNCCRWTGLLSQNLQLAGASFPFLPLPAYARVTSESHSSDKVRIVTWLIDTEFLIYYAW